MPEQAGSPVVHDLTRVFLAEFQVVPAADPLLRNAVFALRHEVYCREFGFEPVRADGLERDVHDGRSRHYLLAHRPTGTWAACVRIVFAANSAQQIGPGKIGPGGIGLPFETALGDVPWDVAAVTGASVGEISRLTVARDFRGRQRGGQRSVLLHTALVAVAAAAESGLGSAVCMMRPRLKVQLGTFGIPFVQLSPIVRHRGDRALFLMVPRTACREIRPELQGVLASVRSQLAARPLG